MFEEDQPDDDGPAAGYREPDPEPDPEADLPDPESELPTIPSVEVPEPEPGEVPTALARGFWTTVLVFNAALLLLTFGVLMLAFGVERPIGAGLLILGLLLVRRGYRLYTHLDERHRAGELTATDGEAEGDGTEVDEAMDDDVGDDVDEPGDDAGSRSGERNG